MPIDTSTERREAFVALARKLLSTINTAAEIDIFSVQQYPHVQIVEGGAVVECYIYLPDALLEAEHE